MKQPMGLGTEASYQQPYEWAILKADPLALIMFQMTAAPANVKTKLTRDPDPEQAS